MSPRLSHAIALFCGDFFDERLRVHGSLFNASMTYASLARAFLAHTSAFIATMCISAQSTFASPPKIPDQWFFEGAQRNAQLKDLEGKPAPELDTDAWIGTSTTIAKNRGKVIIIDFWATWCGPCMAAIPENVALMKKHSDGDLVFIGVHDANNGWDKAAQVAKDKKINYPLAKDKSGASAKAYRVQFWPTYVAIDRAGIVRAAGLIPSHVAEVAQLLLAEGSSESNVAENANASGFGADMYLGGAKSPAALRALEGKPAPAIDASAWIGDAVTKERMKGSVVALQFTTAGNAAANKQFAEFAKLEKEFAAQGVTFVGVCKASANWKDMESAAKAIGCTISIARDAEVTSAATTSDANNATPAAAPIIEPLKLGRTAEAFGVKYFPVTILIDRSGKVRIAGVRIDRVKQVIEQLLAEPTS